MHDAPAMLSSLPHRSNVVCLMARSAGQVSVDCVLQMWQLEHVVSYVSGLRSHTTIALHGPIQPSRQVLCSAESWILAADTINSHILPRAPPATPHTTHLISPTHPTPAAPADELYRPASAGALAGAQGYLAPSHSTAAIAAADYGRHVHPRHRRHQQEHHQQQQLVQEQQQQHYHQQQYSIRLPTVGMSISGSSSSRLPSPLNRASLNLLQVQAMPAQPQPQPPQQLQQAKARQKLQQPPAEEEDTRMKEVTAVSWGTYKLKGIRDEVEVVHCM